MCGIFAMIGNNALSCATTALKMLEYRGYDSVGVSLKGKGLQLYKKVGRVQGLLDILPQYDNYRNVIGHTRWATHGNVCEQNAHPFLSRDGNFAIVHNGILENFLQLKSTLPKANFLSQTDSEVVVHLLQHNYKGDVLQCVLETAQKLKGSFAIVVQNSYDNKLYAIKRQSPLIAGYSEQKAYLCSDVRCLSNYAQKVAFTPDDTVVVADGDKIQFFDFFGRTKKVQFSTPQKCEQYLCDDGDVMLQEIYQIPQKLIDAKATYVKNPLALTKKQCKKTSRVYFVGCGTAYHSGLQVASLMRKYFDVDLLPVVASEFVYDNYPVDDDTLAFCISQSGETADTLRAVEKLNELGAYTYAVTNTNTSTLAHICKRVANISAGGEFAVASTKAYNCQLLTLLLLTLDVAKNRNTIDAKVYRQVVHGMDKLPVAVDKVLANAEYIQELALQIKNSSAVFYLGRTADYPTACEGSLKLKEISYVHSEAYPAGELKHGTLALIEQGVTVIALSTNYQNASKMESSIAEVLSRGAKVVGVSPYPLEKAQCITLPVVHQLLYPIISVVPLQLLAYFVAKALGREVDKPRNLAKSVTVE